MEAIRHSLRLRVVSLFLQPIIKRLRRVALRVSRGPHCKSMRVALQEMLNLRRSGLVISSTMLHRRAIIIISLVIILQQPQQLQQHLAVAVVRGILPVLTKREVSKSITTTIRAILTWRCSLSTTRVPCPRLATNPVAWVGSNLFQKKRARTTINMAA